MEAFSFSVKLTRREYHRILLKFALIPPKLSLILLYFYVVFILISSFFVARYYLISSYLVVFLGFVLCAYRYISFRIQLNDSRIYEEVVRVFNEEYILRKGDTNEHIIKYDELQKVVEYKKWFLFLMIKRKFCIVPKHVFSESQLVLFRSILVSKVKNEILKLK